MKILYIAFACNPYTGSEAQCGWSCVYEMSKHAEVTVLTREENRNSIEKFLDYNISGIEVLYCDIPKSINMYYKMGKLYHLYYLVWLHFAEAFVTKLTQKERYDVIHHITLGDMRFLCGIQGLGAKTVFGPVGGAQVTPKVFSPYVKRDYLKEIIRELINVGVCALPIYRNRIERTDLVYSANEETYSFLREKMKRNDNLKIMTENGVQKTRLRWGTSKQKSGQVTLLWSGRMVVRKGLEFLLEVLADVPKNINYRLLLVGTGPEYHYLQEKAGQLCLTDKIEFVGLVSYEEMQSIYSAADIFLFPSLRETTGTVLFEALSHGLPVITFNQNGAKQLINSECGVLVNTNGELCTVKREFADAIITLVENEEERARLGKNGYTMIKDKYTWEKKCLKMLEDYSEIVK